MKRLIMLVLFLGVVTAAVGVYRGWFVIGSGGENGKSGVTVTVDKDKIKQDKEKAVDKVHQVEQKVEDKVGSH